MGSTNVWSNIQPYWKCRLKVRNVCVYRSLFLLISLGYFAHITVAECPPEDALESEVAACFDKYDNTRRAYIDSNPTKLFLGIDIEILRSYCSSYSEAMHCVRLMLVQCNDVKRKQIERITVTQDGYTEEVKDLCKTANLYELYAQYMNCFYERQTKSNTCYQTKLAYEVQSVYDLSQDELCSRMRDTIQCIENNIRVGCGEKAAELVGLLVKPTVKGSSSCNYYYNIDTTIFPTRRKDVTSQTSKTDRSQGSGKPNTANIVIVHYSVLISSLCIIAPFIYW